MSRSWKRKMDGYGVNGGYIGKKRGNMSRRGIERTEVAIIRVTVGI